MYIYRHSLDQYKSLLAHSWFCVLLCVLIGFLSPKKVYLKHLTTLTVMPVFCGISLWGISHPSKKTKDVKWPSPQAGLECLEDDELRYMSRW